MMVGHRMTGDRLRARFMANLRESRAEAIQITVDTEYWNDNHRPIGVDRINPDPDGFLAAHIAYCDQALAEEFGTGPIPEMSRNLLELAAAELGPNEEAT